MDIIGCPIGSWVVKTLDLLPGVIYSKIYIVYSSFAEVLIIIYQRMKVNYQKNYPERRIIQAE